MKKMEDFNATDIKKYGKKLEYLSNGINYVKTTTEGTILPEVATCDGCCKEITEGYLTWCTHSFLCEDCFNKIRNYTVNPTQDYMLQLQDDPTTYLWYISYFDKDIAEKVAEENMKYLENLGFNTTTF